MTKWYETIRGVVFPWNCDHYGHMNARWYVHHFDDASIHIWTLAGSYRMPGRLTKHRRSPRPNSVERMGKPISSRSPERPAPAAL